MIVREVMRKPVLTVEPTTTLREAASLMADNHVGSVVVVLGGKVQGMLTEHDILKALAEKDDIAQEPVERIMTRGVLTTTPQSTVTSAMAMMNKYHIKKLPVIDQDRLVGIVTATDILIALPSVVPALGMVLRRL